MTRVIPDPNANHPPTFSGGSLDVPKAETATLDLSGLAKDVDEKDQGNLKFELDGTLPAGLKAELDGPVLKVTAETSVGVGFTGAIPLKVTDGRSPAVTATVMARHVASNRPMPVANDDAVDKANAGRTETVNVLANDYNPFADTALKIVAASVETGSASGQPVVEGDSIRVTPSEGFKGVMVIRYTVTDKTGDLSRQASGRLRLTVRDKPDAPSAPAATDVRSRTAVLKWAPPSDNGAQITKYTVTSSGFTQECVTTTCTLSGLTNDVKYVFTVTATNEVGESVSSPPSNEIRPDEKPSPPEAPAVKAGDKDMQITWAPAKTEGSAVKEYNLEISPPPASGVAVKNGVTGLSYTWPALTNGVKYKVRAQAVNELGPSEWGIYSAEDNPAGVPAAPAAPTSAVASSVGTQNQLKVSWNEPNTNGDPIRTYYVTMSGGGGAAQTQAVAGTERTANFTANNSEASYTFTVQAENKAGKGAVSAPSAPRRATGKLGQVSGVTAAPANTGGAGRQRDHQLQAAHRRRTERVGPGRGQLQLQRQQRCQRTHYARRDRRRIHQRCGGRDYRDSQLQRGTQFRCQHPRPRNPLRGAGHAVSVRTERRPEPEVLELQLELSVDGHQRCGVHPDQDRRRGLGTGSCVGKPNRKHRGLRRAAFDRGADRQLPRYRRRHRDGRRPVRPGQDQLGCHRTVGRLPHMHGRTRFRPDLVGLNNSRPPLRRSGPRVPLDLHRRQLHRELLDVAHHRRRPRRRPVVPDQLAG